MAGAPKGNQNAVKGAQLSKRLRDRLEERAKMHEIVDTLIDKAVEGDMAAIKEVFDRCDGKARQQLDVDARISKSVTELSDEELASIAARSSD